MRINNAYTQRQFVKQNDKKEGFKIVNQLFQNSRNLGI